MKKMYYILGLFLAALYLLNGFVSEDGFASSYVVNLGYFAMMWIIQVELDARVLKLERAVEDLSTEMKLRDLKKQSHKVKAEFFHDI